MDDDQQPGGAALERLRERLRRVPVAWWLPLPAVALHLFVLLVSRRVWTEMVETSSRSGRSGSMPAAHRQLVLLAVILVVYALAGLVGRGGWTAGARGMREPTSAEEAVVRVALRGLCLVALYGTAYWAVSRYAFG